jgi:hypothetical protein
MSPALISRRRLVPLAVAGIVAVAAVAAGVYFGLGLGGSSFRNCIYSQNSIRELQSIDRVLGTRVQCVEVFDNTAPTWAAWAHPYFLNEGSSDTAWGRWARQDGGRQVIITQGLIPLSLTHGPWLAQGSVGAYDTYARQLARNLVHGGLGHAIIRLAPEANGTWEVYSLPSTPSGMKQWVLFWQQTVKAMRSVPGAAFKFDWTVNAVTRPVPLTSFYPGDQFVDYIGVDAYQFTPGADSWYKIDRNFDGVQMIAQFARSRDKPFSVPEWGISAGAGPGPTTFIKGIAQAVKGDSDGYQAYFFAHQWETALSREPTSLNVYKKQFGAG